MKIRAVLDRLLWFDGMDETTFQFKKTMWLNTLGISVFISLMYIPVLIFHVKSLFLFGTLLLSVYIPNLVLMLILPFRKKWVVHVNQHLTLLITFFIIVKLGGLHHSGGIILAGLSMVINSIMFYNVRWSIWYFSFYMTCTLLVAGIQWRLNLPPEMPPNVNHLFFLINTLSISAYTLVIVLVYINQYTQIEKNKSERLREINEIKSKLYTNITHEFRTPLTIILGMVDQIKSKPDLWMTRGLDKIKNSGRNLLHLVNQMLDLAKLESGVMKSKVVQGDVIKYLRILTESFDSVAESYGIEVDFHSDPESLIMDYNPDKLLLIFSNLISNAIKYNKSDGRVCIEISVLDHKQDSLGIIVRDTGIGIEKDNLAHIFDRFYRVGEDGLGGPLGAGSSGLGLSITHELVQMMNGVIGVESVVGKGTTFTLHIPITHNAKREEIPVTAIPVEGFMSSDPDDEKPQLDQNPDAGYPLLLIVEDNPDVSEYLQSVLQEEYRIEVADNGISGLEMANKSIPDIILSDVMMPELDGISMLERLKKDIRTSHIPVILLTAKADVESRLEGIQTGAEAYLEKPFNKDELLIRLSMLVEMRKKLRERYSTFIFAEPGKNYALRTEDDFMYKLHETFRNHLGDEDFSVQHLCEVLSISRAQLYRKFKALTNRSIKDYFQSYRLHIAKSLLMDSGLNVTQVAFEVGFKNLSHFSKRFSEEHGIAPSSLKKHTA